MSDLLRTAAVSPSFHRHFAAAAQAQRAMSVCLCALLAAACGAQQGSSGSATDVTDGQSAWDLAGLELPPGADIDFSKLDVPPGSDVDWSKLDLPLTGGKKEPIIDLVVDANRDGVADPKNADDQDFGKILDEKHGASFLVNIDDDDGDKLEDAFDDKVNGDEDAKDLAPLVLVGWPDAPDGYTANLSINAFDAHKVRIFKQLPDKSWELAAGTVNDCKANFDSCDVNSSVPVSLAELRSGLTLGVEGLDFDRDATTEDPWDGSVSFALFVSDAKGGVVTSTKVPTGQEVVKMRVAPWILNGNTTKFDEVRSAKYYPKFVADLAVAVPAQAGMKYTPYSGWNDQWTQDFFQTGTTSIPAPGGKVQGLRVLNARPWGREAATIANTPITWLRKNYLSKDKGIVAFYKKAWTGTSFDSHGNHDLLPPYKNPKHPTGLPTEPATDPNISDSYEDSGDYPFGRIIHGSGILPETHAVYNAQKVQGPALIVKTDWLLVGHIDEVCSYVPAATARGWKLLIASNSLCKTMFDKLAKDGHGAAKFWTGFINFDAKTGKKKDAETTIQATLDDQDLMTWSQEAQVDGDVIRGTIVEALGLTDDEILPMPLFTEDVYYSGQPAGKIAWTPGTVNSLVYYNHMSIPKPFSAKIDGPEWNGKEWMEQDILNRLGSPLNKLGSDGQGLKIHFIDDFESYHDAEGEVHCGTNPEGPAQDDYKWWELKR